LSVERVHETAELVCAGTTESTEAVGAAVSDPRAAMKSPNPDRGKFIVMNTGNPAGTLRGGLTGKSRSRGTGLPFASLETENPVPDGVMEALIAVMVYAVADAGNVIVIVDGSEEDAGNPWKRAETGLPAPSSGVRPIATVTSELIFLGEEMGTCPRASAGNRSSSRSFMNDPCRLDNPTENPGMLVDIRVCSLPFCGPDQEFFAGRRDSDLLCRLLATH
jgi:hypothetical protein